MSAAHMGLVFAAKELDGSEKLLLLALTNFTDPHGYCWPSEARLADDCGTSRSTVQRVKRKLAARGLVKSVRRMNPRTNEPISNLTRVNLPLLESMSREPRRYQDNLIEAITFEDDSQGDPAGPDAPEPSDLLMVQIDADPESNRGVPRVNLTPTQGQDDAQSLIDPVVIPYPTPAPAVAAVPAAAAAGEGGGGNAPQQKQGDDTPAAAFVDALPFPGRLPGLRQRAALVEGVGAAFAAGWAEGALRRQLTSETGGAHSLVGLYLHRLEPGNLPAPRAAGPADRGGTPVPPRWAEQQARVAVLAGRECGGDGGMCGRPVPAGEVWCLVCAPAAV